MSTTHTIQLHRIIRTTPEKLYRAFLEAEAMAKWNPPHGFTCKVHELEPRVGGRFRMSFTNFGTGSTHFFGGTYLELVPQQRLRYTDKFEDAKLPGEMITTVSIRAVSGGSELRVEQAGVPGVIPAEMCYLGWQESLAQLAALVEPEIPDAS